MYKYKDNVNALKAKMEELGVQEEKIKRKIESDEDDGKTIEDRVLKWQLDVQQIKDEVEEFLKMYGSKRSWRCLKVLRFPNLYSRFRTGREAVKKTAKVNGLTVPGKEFVDGEISYRPRLVYADLPSTTSFDNDYERFESREDAYKKILEALNNKDAGFVVGVYGMAGAGKTRMMEQAWKQARRDRIFDEVARADVSSEKLDVRKLQGQLASCLNLHLPSEENEEMRASLLANRLTTKGNKILVLFDDVWEELPLNKIGVPFADGRSKGCKIMLTSRKLDVCFKNKCEDPIEIKVLKGEEGWDLFTKNVGSSTINSLNDESLAKKVCKECACLPLVIAAVGKALKGKPHDSWKDALDQLQDSKLENIDGIDPKVYIGLELSFNHLQKDAKSCLFLCSVFPEDAAISIEELARLVKGNRLIEELDTLEKARGRVRSMVVALKNSSLLLPYDDDTEVKLHDIIRDVAKSVAAKNPEYAFLEKSGTKWPDVYYKDRKLISLSFDGINYFPPEDDLACPELHTLVLKLGTYQKGEQFPDWFFSGFPKLRVLVLNVRSNSNLPPSLQSLTNLRMLSLHNADRNMSLIKELKNLEMLVIFDRDIKELSLELRELKRLRLLDE